MRKRDGNCKFSAALLIGVSLLAVMLIASLPAAAQDAKPAAKGPCVGCSVDGKTTPRGADGHPNLNGFWNNLQIAGTENFERSADGRSSLISRRHSTMGRHVSMTLARIRTSHPTNPNTWPR